MTNVDLATTRALAFDLATAQMSTNIVALSGNVSLLSLISQGIVSLQQPSNNVQSLLNLPINYAGA